jgi:hypothetical protein
VGCSRRWRHEWRCRIPFLTDIDSRAAIKGSRDPLGVQPIWTKLGRHVVGNLTTVSTSVRDFTTLLLGYYFAERVAESGGGDSDLAVFLKWEQLAAYARWEIIGDRSFRGTERTGKKLQESRKVSLGVDSASQILSNQKIYGLWGLYTVPARSSGLVGGNPTRLTDDGRRLVESVYISVLTKEGFRNADYIAKRLAETRIGLDLNRQRDGELLRAVAKVLQRRLLRAERDVFRDHLLLGGLQDRTGGAQVVLASAFETTLDDREWRLSPARVSHLAKVSRGLGDRGAYVADKLKRIRTCELLMAPSVVLYGFLLGSDGQTLAEVASSVRKQWGRAVSTVDLAATADLEAELKDAVGDADAGARWMHVARAIAGGEYEEALRLLLDQNRFVMKMRNGAAPWIELRDGKLQVRFRDDNAPSLPERDALLDFWIHPYFLNSLRTIAFALRE